MKTKEDYQNRLKALLSNQKLELVSTYTIETYYFTVDDSIEVDEDEVVDYFLTFLENPLNVHCRDIDGFEEDKTTFIIEASFEAKHTI